MRKLGKRAHSHLACPYTSNEIKVNTVVAFTVLLFPKLNGLCVYPYVPELYLMPDHPNNFR